MKVGSLFSGIGGFDLGLERAGMEVVWQVEIDPFCNKVLAKHWPNVKRFLDVKTVGSKELEPVDLICGGFPCQPFSCAGKRRGKEDHRALWPEMFRIIQEVRPRWIIGENVAGIIGMELGNYISDLEREGYTVQAFVIPACAVGAPHRRDRVWICAHSLMCEHGTSAGQIRETDGIQGINRSALRSGRIERTNSHAPNANGSGSGTPTSGTNGNRTQGSEEQQLSQSEYSGQDSDAPDSNSEGLQGKSVNTGSEGQKSNDEQSMRCGGEWQENWLEVATSLCRVDDGLPRQVDRVARLKALGNAVVPQVVEIIGRAIMEIENA